MLFWSDFTCFSKHNPELILKKKIQLRTNKKWKLKDYFTHLTELCLASHYLRVLVYCWTLEVFTWYFYLIPRPHLLFPFLSFQQELVLRDNKLTDIPDMSIFKSLLVFDVSFNEITSLMGLSKVSSALKELYVSKNEVLKIEALDHFHSVEILELGSNRLRVSLQISSLYCMLPYWYTGGFEWFFLLFWYTGIFLFMPITRVKGVCYVVSLISVYIHCYGTVHSGENGLETPCYWYIEVNRTCYIVSTGTNNSVPAGCTCINIVSCLWFQIIIIK